MAGNGDFQVICRICNQPLKLGIDTAADEDGKAVPRPAMQNKSRTHVAMRLGTRVGARLLSSGATLT